jgi:hypothetical protein
MSAKVAGTVLALLERRHCLRAAFPAVAALVLASSVNAQTSARQQQFQARSAAIQAALPAGELPTALQGRWVAVVHCSGQDHWLDTTLGSDSQATVAAKDAQSAQTPQRGNWPPNWRIGYDAGAQRMVLQPDRGPQGTSLDLVSADSAWAGRLNGRGWEECSAVLLMRPQAADKFRASLPGAPSQGGLSGLLHRSPFGQILGKLTRREPCDRDVMAWVQAYLERFSGQGQNLDKQAMKQAAIAMFDDAVFKKAFGKPLQDMSLDESRQLAQVVQTAAQCPMPPQQQSLAGRTLHWLTPPLLDGPQLSRNHVAVGLAAKSSIRIWGQQLAARIEGWEAADPTSVDPTALRGAAAALTVFANAAELAEGGAALQKQLANTGERVASAKASETLLADAAEVAAQMDALQQLALRSRADVSPQPHAAARQAALDRVNALLPAAAETLAATATGVQGWQRLQNWRNDYSPLVAIASAETQAAAQAAIDTQQQSLVARLTQGWRSEFASQVAALPQGAQALAAGTAFEQRLRQEASAMWALQEVQLLAKERAARRSLDMAIAHPELVARIQQAPNLSALQALQQKYLLPGDESFATAQTVAQAMQTRQQTVAPLQGLPAADYLNALHSGDFDRLQALDRAFSKPYRADMVGLMNHVAPITDLVGVLTGVKVDYAAMMAKAIDEISLIVPMFAVYLIDYEGRLGPCLEPDAVSFKITRASETVYKDGRGNVKYSRQNPDRVEYFKVNRRFADVFRSVGLTNPKSPLAGLIDSNFRNQDRVGITELVQGTRALMQRLDSEGCGSPLMQKMEANMLTHFDRYRQRNQSILEAGFGPTR